MYIYELTQLKSPDFPWQIVAYLFVGGIASGAYIISALLQAFGGSSNKPGLHRAYYLAFILTPICGLLLIGKLQVKSRFINVLWQGRDGNLMLNTNSPMSVGAWVLSVFALVATIGLLYALSKDGKLKGLRGLYRIAQALHEGPIAKLYLTVASIFAAWFSVYLGILLTTTQLPTWKATPLIPVLWMGSAIVTGVSTVMLILLFSKEKDKFSSYVQGLSRIVSSILVLNVVMLIIFFISVGQWQYTISSGMFGVLLWGGTLVVGLLLPLIFILKPTMLGVRTSLVTSSILILVGGLILRYVVVMGPQSFW